jgi:hypothetical protein
MKRFFLAVILGLFVSAQAIASQPPLTITDPLSTAPAGNLVAGLGVDYFVYDTGTYDPEMPGGDSNNWYIPGHNFKTPIGLYQLNPSLVTAQLQNMRASGMDWVTIQIQITNLHCETDGSGSCNDGFVDGVWGEVNDYSKYALTTQAQQNLRSMLQTIQSLGFRYVIIRFMNYSPGNGDAFDETRYQQAWNSIVHTHDLVYSALNGAITKPLFDLDGEGPGSPSAVRKQYDQRLWSDYTYTYGNNDTVGFSIIADDYHLTNGIPWFGSIKPRVYAFDIYGDVGAGLLKAWRALGTEGSKPILIMETYFNDATTASQLSNVLASNPGIHLKGVLQWQTTRAPACSGCTTAIRSSAVSALNSLGQAVNYDPILARFVADESNPQLMSAKDVNCSTTSGTCSVQLQMHTGNLPAYKVYVRMPGQTPQIMDCEGQAKTVQPNWIQKNRLYEFTYYAVASCSSSVSGVAPSAIVVLSTRN